MPESFDISQHPVILQLPGRLSDVAAWVEHIPFGMLLVDLARPRTIVELGTHSGNSYCGFCQAVCYLELPTRCFAVDTWQGDEHAGLYGPEILEELRAHHDGRYGTFSTLMQTTFDDALASFEDATIDLLHIDGLHTYEAVRHDFESWLPKLSSRGIVVFHDTNVHKEDFGVWRLWQELSRRNPHLEFLHGFGLGVACIGPDEPAGLRAFREAFNSNPWLGRLFEELGGNLSLRLTVRAAEQEIAEKEAREALVAAQTALLRDRETTLTVAQATLARLEAALAQAQELCSDREAALAALTDPAEDALRGSAPRWAIEA
ncbi:MAG: hypothetical protein NVSMB32_11220 [Actinomycetota bacterium]